MGVGSLLERYYILLELCIVLRITKFISSNRFTTFGSNALGTV